MICWDDWSRLPNAHDLLKEFDSTGRYEKDGIKYEKPISPKRELRYFRWADWKSQDDALEQLLLFIETGKYTREGKYFSASEMLRHPEGYIRVMDFVGNNLRNWIKEDQEREDAVKSARRIAADNMAQKSLDVIVECKADSNIAVNKAKAESDSRKWLAGCIDNAYSNRTETTVKGDKDNPLSVLLGQLNGSSLQPVPSDEINDDE